MDYRIPLAVTLLMGGAIGLAMPLFSDEAAPGDAAANTATLAALDTADADPAWHEEHVLDREEDGHFYADVTVDGTVTRMLVDTGASVVALTGEDAAAMGITWDEADVGPIAQSANGTVYGVDAMLARVSVGDFEAEGVQAVIVPEGLAVSLLGQSFLSTVGNVEIAEGRMVLGDRQP